MAKKGGSESTTTASLATMFSLLFSSGNPAATLQQQLQQQLETTYTGVNIHVFLDKKQVTDSIKIVSTERVNTTLDYYCLSRAHLSLIRTTLPVSNNVVWT